MNWWNRMWKAIADWFVGEHGNKSPVDEENDVQFAHGWVDPDYLNSIDDWADFKRVLGYVVNIDPSLNPEKYVGKSNLEQWAYSMRNHAIMVAVNEAMRLGLKAGYVVHEPIEDMLHMVDGSVPCVDTPYDNVSFPKWSPRWGVVAIIELPTGQVSWHMDSGDLNYDGHTNEDKVSCVKAFVEGGTNG